MHSGAQASGLSFGHTGDQIGGPSQSQRGRKAAHDCDDLPFQPERFRSVHDGLARDRFKPSARIPHGLVTQGSGIGQTGSSTNHKRLPYGFGIAQNRTLRVRNVMTILSTDFLIKLNRVYKLLILK